MLKGVFKFTTQIYVSLDLWLMSMATVWKALKTYAYGKPNLATSTTQPSL